MTAMHWNMITLNNEQSLFLVQALKRQEGTGPVQKGRLMPYKDGVGKLTIGYGRCIEDIGISETEAGMLLCNDIQSATVALATALPWASSLDWPRQYVLLNMVFNMGLGDTHRGLLSFVNTLGLIKDGKYKVAAEAMLKSKWAAQVGPRAKELAAIMESGVLK